MDDVSIIFPPMLGPAGMKALLDAGVLKYDAYVEFVSHFYGMNENLFHSEPQVPFDPLAARAGRKIDRQAYDAGEIPM
jgi:hypothetical protein